jgi:hypothetical protein
VVISVGLKVRKTDSYPKISAPAPPLCQAIKKIELLIVHCNGNEHPVLIFGSMNQNKPKRLVPILGRGKMLP